MTNILTSILITKYDDISIRVLNLITKLMSVKDKGKVIVMVKTLNVLKP